jgi:hypothetical protein
MESRLRKVRWAKGEEELARAVVKDHQGRHRPRRRAPFPAGDQDTLGRRTAVENDCPNSPAARFAWQGALANEISENSGTNQQDWRLSGNVLLGN